VVEALDRCLVKRKGPVPSWRIFPKLPSIDYGMSAASAVPITIVPLLLPLALLSLRDTWHVLAWEQHTQIQETHS